MQSKYIDKFQIDVDIDGIYEESVTFRFGDNPAICVRVSNDGEEPISALLESFEVFKYHGHSELVLYDLCIGHKTKCALSSHPDGVRLDIEHFNGEWERYVVNTRRWSYTMPLSVYKEAIVGTALTALKRYGCKGISESWHVIGGTYFLGRLVSLLSPEDCERVDTKDDNYLYRSDIKKELQTIIDALEE